MRLLITSVIVLSGLLGWASGPEIYPSDTSFCSGDSVVLEVTNGYASYAWNTGDSGRVLYVSDGGWYIVDVTDTNGTHYYDSIYIHEHTPRALTYSVDPDSTVYCAGTRVTIQLDTGFVAYWWNTGNRYANASYILFQDKRLVVEAEDSNGCGARVVIELEVVDCDTCNLIEQDTIIHCGEAVNVKAKYGFDHYRWNDSSDDRSRWIDSSGWYFVEGKRDGVWICRDSVFIQLYPKPYLEYDTDPSNGVICAGDTIAIELNHGFEEYHWSTGHRGRYVELVLERSRTIVVEAVDSNGCVARKEIPIEVRACGDCDLFSRDSIVHCHEDSIQLEAAYGYSQYLWRDGAEGRLRWVSESGWYHLKAKDSGQWCFDSIYVELNRGLNLEYESDPDPLIVCEGDSAVIELTPGFHIYHWSSRHTGDRAVIYPLGDTVIVVEALDSNGCEDRLEIEIEVKRCTNSAGSLNSIGFNIYPNPTRGELHIDLPSGDWIGASIEVFDLSGRMLEKAKLSSLEYNMDLHSLPKGTYLLKIGPYHHRILLH